MINFKNLLLGLITIALAVSLVLNYFLYQKAFLPLQLSKLDPVGLNYYEEASQPTDSDVKKLMLFGDSRALSWPSYQPENIAVMNRAIGNQTSTQILQRFDAHVSPHQPHTILVQMCVNDLKMIPLFPEREQPIVEDCQNNLSQLINKARAIEADLVLSTVFPLGDISIFRKAMGMREAPIIRGIDKINAFIKAQQADDVIVFDSHALLLGEDNKIKPEYSRDWLHLNAAGYQHLNQQLAGFMKESLSQ